MCSSNSSRLIPNNTSSWYLWWTLLAFLVARLLHTENPRYWLGIGAVIGLGMMTKYTMAVCAADMVAGVLLTPARRYLGSPWLWGGVLLSVLVFLPNLAWQAQHGWIHLEFLTSIHGCDFDENVIRPSPLFPPQ